MRGLGVGRRADAEGALPVGAGAAPRRRGRPRHRRARRATRSCVAVAARASPGVARRRSPRSATSRPPGTLRARRGLPAAIACRGLQTFAFFGADAFLALALASVRGLSAVEVGLVLTPGDAHLDLRLVAPGPSRRPDSRRTLATAGVVLVAVGIALAARPCSSSDVPVWVAGVAWGIGGLGMGLSYSTDVDLVVLSEADDGGQGVGDVRRCSSATCSAPALGTGLGGAIVAVARVARAGRGATRSPSCSRSMVVVALLGIVAARRFPPRPAAPLVAPSSRPRAGPSDPTP